MRFAGPADLARHLYDRAATPGMSPVERVILAHVAANEAIKLYREYQ